MPSQIDFGDPKTWQAIIGFVTLLFGSGIVTALVRGRKRPNESAPSPVPSPVPLPEPDRRVIKIEKGAYKGQFSMKIGEYREVIAGNSCIALITLTGIEQVKVRGGVFAGRTDTDDFPLETAAVVSIERAGVFPSEGTTRLSYSKYALHTEHPHDAERCLVYFHSYKRRFEFLSISVKHINPHANEVEFRITYVCEPRLFPEDQ